jgi:hypothetical protein
LCDAKCTFGAPRSSRAAGTDYPFRVFAARADLQKAAAALVADVRTIWSVLRRREEGASG